MNSSVNEMMRVHNDRIKSGPIGYYITLVFLAISLLIYYYFMATGDSAGTDDLFMNTISIASSMLFFLTMIIIVYFVRPLALELMILCAGSFLFVLAEIVWNVYKILNGTIIYPSIADIFFILGGIVLIAAVYVISRQMNSDMGFSPIIILLTTIISILFLGAYYLIAQSSISFDIVLVTDFTYLMIDIILLVLSINMQIMSIRKNICEPITILVSGIMFMTVSDVLFISTNRVGHYDIGYFPDFLFVISYVVLSIGAIRYIQIKNKAN